MRLTCGFGFDNLRPESIQGHKVFKLTTLSIVLGIFVGFTGCLEDNSVPKSLAEATPSGGAKIIFDLDARPFPEIPFPNNLATRVDPTSPTGRRINVSLEGSSDQEERVRKALNKMTGFGIISPFWVRFDKLIDLQNVVDRHQERVPNFEDDAVYLVNVDKKSPGYGEFELLDLGRGNFPILMEEPDRYFPNDPRVMGTNLLFESVEEIDLNGNGILDPMEDTDDDGVWDKPNLLNPGQDPYNPGNSMEWYERETNTLIIRAVKPLRAETTYAVVLTSKLIDADGFPVDSPFEGINHTKQNKELEGLQEILPAKFPNRFTQNLTNVRFAWSFTTQDPTKEMLGIRAGLYGQGKFSYLEKDFPAELKMIHNVEAPGVKDPLTFDLARVINFVLPLFGNQISSEAISAISDSYTHVDYIVSGSYVSPYFMADKDGLADTGEELVSLDGNPQDDDEAWDINPETGEGSVGEDEVTFICSVPKTIPGVREPPFNTMLYSHAISSTRLEILLFAGSFAKFGFAVCVIDAVGHGVVVPANFAGLITRVTENLEIPNFQHMVNHHRARDLNNDGIADSGGKAFSSDLLHSRDNLRQTAVDQIQLIRILRSWDGAKVWPNEIDKTDPYIAVRGDLVGGFDQNGDGKGEIAGDFNGDGIVDFGGDITYVAMGTSLGGIQTSITAAVEPTIRTAGSNSGGGVVGELASRTTISNVRNGGLLRLMGPLLTGTPQLDADRKWTSGEMLFGWTLATADEQVYVPLGLVSGLKDGYKVVLRNPNREKRAVVPEEDKKAEVHIRNGRFRVGISADAMMATERRARLGFDFKVSARDEVLGCQIKAKCGETTCPDGEWACSRTEADTCIGPIRCLWDFEEADLQSVDEENKASYIAEYNARVVKDPTTMGDPLIIEIHDENGEIVQTIDTFLENAIYENIIYPKGAPLAAITEGLGLPRQTPNFRKLLAIGQTLMEGADPAVFAPHYFKRPFAFPYEDDRFKDGTTDFLMMGTIGDQVVPISNSLAIARAAGIIDVLKEDGDRKTTQNQFLVENSVYEGVAWFNRFVKFPDSLFDPDDLDNGQFEPGKNKDADVPLRIVIPTAPGRGVSALRLIYLQANGGAHTFNAPTPDATFDTASFFTNLVALYLTNSGDSISDDPCMADLSMKSCTFMDIENFTPPKIK